MGNFVCVCSISMRPGEERRHKSTFCFLICSVCDSDCDSDNGTGTGSYIYIYQQWPTGDKPATGPLQVLQLGGAQNLLRRFYQINGGTWRTINNKLLYFSLALFTLFGDLAGDKTSLLAITRVRVRAPEKYQRTKDSVESCSHLPSSTC